MIEETKELDLFSSNPQIEKGNSQVKNNGDENVKGKVTANDIYRLLAQKYSSTSEWVIAGEVQRTTGWSDRRYDFVAMNCYPSSGYKIEVVEIKISKPDLRRELEEPEKHNVIFEQIDYYSLAAPAEIIDMSIIPPKWGVYAVKDGKLITKRKPLALHDDADRSIKRSFAASFLRAAISQNLEKKTLAKALQEKFDAGYEQGKASCGWDSQKQKIFEDYKNEANTYRRMLDKLGFPVYMRDCQVKDDEMKKRLDLLTKCSDIIKALDAESLQWAISRMEDGLSNIKSAMEEILGVDRFNAASDMLSDLGCSILIDVDLGHLAPSLPIKNGAIATVSYENGNIIIDYEE